MARKLSVLLLFAVVLTACGGAPSISTEDLADLRATHRLADYSDEDLLTVARNLCEAFTGSGGGFSAGGLDEAWAEVGSDEVGIDEILASIDLLQASCPEALTPEVVADSEPIPVSFTLRGSNGDEFTYSAFGGCSGLGGYGDFREGMLFNLSSERGEILGIARLDESELTSSGCRVSGSFAVTFGQLRDDVLYVVGDRAGRRGELAYTGAELKQRGSIDLTLGG